ncbi:hypothetical protein [Aneurinibacillus aneurinilyticus]|nr:hypothetical protein [Aneurinibacillus aneurinilyticus]
MEQYAYNVEPDEMEMIKNLIIKSIEGDVQAIVKIENMELFILDKYSVKI